MTDNETAVFEELKELLKTREWYGAMSDAPGPWRLEDQQHKKTKVLALTLARVGYAAQVNKLWDDMAPKGYDRPLV